MKRQWLTSFADFLVENNITHIIASPGSRNAPLLIHLTNKNGLNIYSHVDERSAAYLALGMAQYLKSTVALVCTSGSALLNYGPALSEASYQQIPLLVLSADRSPEWIDQSDGQTIQQNNIFKSFIKKSYSLPVEVNHPDDEWFIWRTLSEAIYNTRYPIPGPVHVNMPFREPLYDFEAVSESKPKSIHVTPSLRILNEQGWDELTVVIKNARKIIIVAGLYQTDRNTRNLLSELSKLNHLVVFSDINSNQYDKSFIRASDDIMSSISETDKGIYQADILISFGGPIISKSLKTWFRSYPPTEHWHINQAFEAPDTFKCLSKIIPSDINPFLEGLIKLLSVINSDYSNNWKSILTKINNRRDQYFENSAFSDFKVTWFVSKHIPENSVLHLANSMPVRYAHLLDWPLSTEIFSNRGVSGIEGCVSTSVGSAMQNKKFTSLITGDLAMLYDSHSLWNQNFPGNLKIIILNNGGGGIFRIIDGPGQHKTKLDYFETPHQYNMENLARMYNISYIGIRNETELDNALNIIYEDTNKPYIIEVFTEQEINAATYHNYYKFIKGAN